jgi:hypothetical protein
MANQMPFDSNIREQDMLFDSPEDERPTEVDLGEAEMEVTELEDGSVVIDLDGPGDPEEEPDSSFGANLAETLPESTLTTIAADLLSDIEDDLRGREEWEKAYKDGLKLLGLKYEDRTEPWNGASGVFHPMMLEAAVRFQSETMMETFPAHGPVLTKIIGKETKRKMQAALRVRADMNYQVTERMVEFRGEHDSMLLNLPIIGCAFKKVYKDPTLGRMVSKFVSAEDIILQYGATNGRSSERLSYRIRYTKNKLKALMAKGFYVESDVGDAQRMQTDIQEEKDKAAGLSNINDDRFTVYESVVLLEIEEDPLANGRAMPYVITVCRDNDKVLGIRRNWEEDDEHFVPCQHFVQYDYVPGMGPYGMGLIHLIGGYAKAGTSLLRQLIDAGTLSNLPGGLKSKGMRIKGDDSPIRPGEFRDVDVGSGTVRDNIIPLPYKEPSATLHLLLKDLIEEGRRLPGMADMKISDMSSQAPVGTTLALIERQLKVMTAVQARVHNSLKEELKLIKNGVAKDDESPYDYEPHSGSRADRHEDYAMVEVVPVSDPNAATMTQRLIQYQAAIQLSQSAPQLYNLALLHRDMLETIGFKNADKLVPLPEDLDPMDPVTENMRVLRGDPIKAFLHQDHEAHIAVHTAALQDPVLMQMMGQNPMAQQMMASAQAHISEHIGFAYRQKIEAELGVVLPPEEEVMPPDVEGAVSQLMARAAMRLLQRNQAAAQAQQNQQAQEDPVMQLQMREADRKDKEVEIKGKLADAKIAGDADRIKHLEQQLQINAAEKADLLRLKEQDQLAKQEVAEQNVVVSAAKVGVMGRAQDQAVLTADREAAFRLMEQLRQQNQGNDVGESSKKGTDK